MVLLAVAVLLTRTALAIMSLWHIVSFFRYFSIKDSREDENKLFRQYIISGVLIVFLAIIEAVIATSTGMWVVLLFTMLVGFLFD